jgi:Protein of unknown function (DUF3105)
LAKKAKTPPPPRRPVQAPKQRSAVRTPAERRTWLYLMIFAASGFVILGALIAFVAVGNGGGDGGSSAISSKDCVEQAYPGLPPKHLATPDEKVKYNSFPPSSGPHFQQPAPWGIYEEPIKQTILVHNLEHGGIIIQYGDVGSGAVSELRSFYEDDPYGLVIAPFPKLGKKFALTAWNEPAYQQEGKFKNVDPGKGYVLTCTKFDSKTFAKFRDTHRNKSGERYPSVKDMAPQT